MNWKAVDGFIFCRSCNAAHGNGLGPQVEPSGYLNIPPFPTPTTYIRHMGERAVVSELTYQPYLCSFGNIVTAMGTPVPWVYSATRIQPP